MTTEVLLRGLGQGSVMERWRGGHNFSAYRREHAGKAVASEEFGSKGELLTIQATRAHAKESG